MATFKHISSKNADYGAAEQYLTFEHDEFTMKPTLDEAGRLILREDYRIATLDCGEETTYAADTRTEKTSEDTRSSAASQRTYLLAGAQPVVQSVQAPQVRGVAVLCQGGGNAGTQRRITELVSALTGVGASHITVNKMQS